MRSYCSSAALAIATATFLTCAADRGNAAETVNDFPTAARADYVFACMAANGQTQAHLVKCSCSIDEIASRMSYDEYVKAETVMRMRHVPGPRGALFSDIAWMNGIVNKLRSAQVEADLKCF